MKKQCSVTPGTPKVAVVSPTAMTRMSYATSNCGRRPFSYATALVHSASFRSTSSTCAPKIVDSIILISSSNILISIYYYPLVLEVDPI